MTTQTSIFDLSTDKLDYAPGDTALFTLTGVDIGGSVEFQVLHVSDPGADMKMKSVMAGEYTAPPAQGMTPLSSPTAVPMIWTVWPTAPS